MRIFKTYFTFPPSTTRLSSNSAPYTDFNVSSYAILSDNTEVIAWAKENPGFTVGVPSLGSADTIAPAVTKGNTELKDWVNTELETLGKENFVHKAYDETLKSVYGAEFEDSLVVEGGKIK